MPNIATCPKCGKVYEGFSEEFENYPGRLCNTCFKKALGEKENIEKAGQQLLEALLDFPGRNCSQRKWNSWLFKRQEAIRKAMGGA